MDDLKTSLDSIQRARSVHNIMSKYVGAVGIVINNKKCAIQLSIETRLPESLQEIPRLDGTTYKHLGFEMKGEMVRKVMMRKLEERIEDKLEDPAERVV